MNRGPFQPANLRVGTLNTRSAHVKAALIQDIITSEHIDCLVITETWFDDSAVYLDMLSDGYNIHLKNRVG